MREAMEAQAAGGKRASTRTASPDVPMERKSQLERLLLSLFGDGELRRWIARDPECAVVADKLPGAGASPPWPQPSVP